MLSFNEIKYPSLAVAALASFILGWIWYGQLFGEIWSKAVGISMQEGQQPNVLAMLGEFCILFLRAFGIATIMKLSGSLDIKGGFRVGLFVSIFFIITSQAGVWFWQGKLGLFLIDGGIQCITSMVMGMIIGFWDKVTAK